MFYEGCSELAGLLGALVKDGPASQLMRYLGVVYKIDVARLCKEVHPIGVARVVRSVCHLSANGGGKYHQILVG